VVPDLQEEVRLVSQARDRLDDAVGHRIASAQQALDDLRSRPVLRDPTSAFAAHVDRLALLRHRLRSAVEQRVGHEDRALASAIAGIRAMSPKATLERGYALLVDGEGRTVSSVADTRTSEQLTAHIVDGTLVVTVDDVIPKE